MQNNKLTVLALGDVVGGAGTEAVCSLLRPLRREFGADLAIVNGENSADGYGVSPQAVSDLLHAGADVVTGGNHSLKNYDIFDMLGENPRLLRPLNLSPAAPGGGWYIADGPCGLRVLVISAMGQVFMTPEPDNPFIACERLLKEQSGRYDIAVCDLHAEATSEKAAFASYFDGRIHVVFGTHTHVQTSDRRIFPGGTGLVTDVGMCGVCYGDSIIGVKSKAIVKRFVTGIAERHEKAVGDAVVHGAAFTIDLKTRKVCDITSFERQYS